MFLAEIAVLGLEPVPVSTKSLMPRSSLLGESREGRTAMLDFGDSRTLVLDTEREKRDMRLTFPWCMLSVCTPASCGTT